MMDDWLQRLEKAIQDDGRSMRAISTAAKCGPNFVQQMLRDSKEPGADKLARILDTLGSDAALYVMTGIHMTEQDREFLRIITNLSGPLKADAMAFFRSLQAAANTQAQSDDLES